MDRGVFACCSRSFGEHRRVNHPIQIWFDTLSEESFTHVATGLVYYMMTIEFVAGRDYQSAACPFQSTEKKANLRTLSLSTFIALVASETSAWRKTRRLLIAPCGTRQWSLSAGRDALFCTWRGVLPAFTVNQNDYSFSQNKTKSDEWWTVSFPQGVKGCLF